MATHECKRSNEIDDIKKVIFGNGQPGLKEIVIRLQVSQERMEPILEGLQTSLSGILKYIDTTEGEKRQKLQSIKAMRWLVGTNITIIGIVIAVIFELLNK